MRKMSESQAAAFRKSLYALAPALSAVLVVFGIWTNEQAAVVTGAVTPIITTILAYFNTDPSLYSDKAPSSEASSEVE